MIAALFGNQNCGKSTLFNALTGGHAHTGNFPGVTVSLTEGTRDGLTVVDLPGIYALRAQSDEERLARAYAESGQADVFLCVVDGSAIRRGLALPLSLLAFGVPLVIAVNLMDEVRAAGGKIDCAALSQKIGVPVIPVSARSGENLAELEKAVRTVNKTQLANRMACPGTEPETLFRAVDALCKNTVFLKENTTVPRIDRLLTGRFTGIPCFLLLLTLVLLITFCWLGPLLGGVIESGVAAMSDAVAHFLRTVGAGEFTVSLVTEGVITSVGSVLSFLPSALLLFFFLSFFEDCGYMARVAFVLDAPMRACGFSGKALVPLLLGLGCSVPALLSCRTLEEKRRSTSLAVPCIPCSAHLPIFLMLSRMLFKRGMLVVLLLYLLAFGTALLMGLLTAEHTPPPYLLELPPYRRPRFAAVARSMAEKTADFLKRTFTILLIAGVAVWWLAHVGPGFTLTETDSYLSRLARFLLPVFAPLGFSSWQTVAALLAGVSAKEAILSTFAVLNVTAASFTPASGLAFLAFSALYTPCVATLGVMLKEQGKKAVLISLLVQTSLAYAAAFVTYTAGLLLWG